MEQALGIHLGTVPFFILWFCGGVMLIGMALYKWGVLSAAKDDRFYQRLAAVGLLAGAPLAAFGIWWNFAGGWSWQRSMFVGELFNTWGCLPMALGYLGLVMLAVRRGFLPGLQVRLAAVGRMAFTNYLLQTVLCTAIFYGHGLGLYGSRGEVPATPGRLRGVGAPVVVVADLAAPVRLRPAGVAVADAHLRAVAGVAASDSQGEVQRERTSLNSRSTLIGAVGSTMP